MERAPSASGVAQDRVTAPPYRDGRLPEERNGSDKEYHCCSSDLLFAAEKERRLRAERLVEALKQSCLEFSRLLELEKQKTRRLPASPGPVDLSVSGGGQGDGGSRRGLSVPRRESCGESDGGGSLRGDKDEGGPAREPKRKVRRQGGGFNRVVDEYCRAFLPHLAC